ncbi:MAG: hypothetical protein ABL897_14070 [Hyphomicrobium sp.]
MMQDATGQQRILQWITSLAITIVCCAIFFLVFSGQFLAMQKEVTAARVETGMLEARLNYLESHILWGQRHQVVNDVSKTSSPLPVNMPAPVPGEAVPVTTVPHVALPVVNAPAESVPDVAVDPASAPIPLNMPHEFNPDERPAASGYATPIEAPKKP